MGSLPVWSCHGGGETRGCRRATATKARQCETSKFAASWHGSVNGSRAGSIGSPPQSCKPPGFVPRRLSDDRAQALTEAEDCNAALDRWYRGEVATPKGPAPGSLTALDDLFQRDDTFTVNMKPHTQRDYLYGIKPALESAGTEKVTALTQRVVKAWYRHLRGDPWRSKRSECHGDSTSALSFGCDEGDQGQPGAQAPGGYTAQPGAGLGH